MSEYYQLSLDISHKSKFSYSSKLWLKYVSKLSQSTVFNKQLNEEGSEVFS